MSGPALSDAAVPRLPRGVRLREDAARGGWVLLAPERVLALDDVAVAILREVDGVRSFGRIVTDLAERYAAPRETIAEDAGAFLAELAAKRMLEIEP